MPQFDDDLYLGPVVRGGSVSDGPSAMTRGIGPMARVYIFDVVPLTLQAAGLAAAQAVAGAGNLTLTAGTGVTTSVDAGGTTRYVLDTPRCVTLVSANAGDTTQTATVSGYDLYGQAMSAVVTLNGTSTVATTKAFKSVTRIAISAVTAGNISAGFNDKLGIPVRVTDAAYVVSVKWAATLAADAGTFVAADTTSPATTSTTDVRGCYTPSSAANGTRRLVMAIAIPAIGVGPNATRVGALGVDQV
jgi:hypothetical protein